MGNLFFWACGCQWKPYCRFCRVLWGKRRSFYMFLPRCFVCASTLFLVNVIKPKVIKPNGINHPQMRLMIDISSIPKNEMTQIDPQSWLVTAPWEDIFDSAMPVRPFEEGRGLFTLQVPLFYAISVLLFSHEDETFVGVIEILNESWWKIRRIVTTLIV